MGIQIRLALLSALLLLAVQPLSGAERLLSEKQSSLYAELEKKTAEHVAYLSQNGLEERAQGIQLKVLPLPGELAGVNLTPFHQRTAIPQEVLDFDPAAKNTLITTDPEVAHNKPEDLARILSIRLYPALRELIISSRLEVFLGNRHEMHAYYHQMRTATILFEFQIPSSATYFLAESTDGESFMIMADLASRENLVAQLLTLKLASIDVEAVEIIGCTRHFTSIVQNDIDALLKQIPRLSLGNHVLIVAGCGLEKAVNEIIRGTFGERIGETELFRGDLVSLSYSPLLDPARDVHGFISLDLNYGEVMEPIVSQLLDRCGCRYVFTGSAGGFIPRESDEERPSIGTRVRVVRSMNESGEVVTLDDDFDLPVSKMHLQIPSIFMETYSWLDAAKQRGTSVDVETFYMMRAIRDYNLTNPPKQVTANCGYFVSDYVGEKPLREYTNVYRSYPEILSQFINEF